MLQFIMEKNVLLYALTAACVIGVLSQLILRRIYDGLLREVRDTGEPEGRFLQQLRQRFQYCTHLNEQVGNVQALIQKSMMDYRVLGVSLHGWRRLGGSCLVVSLLCAFAGTLVRVQGGAAVITGNPYFWLGVGASVLTALAYGLADSGYQSQALLVCLSDYLENGTVASVRQAEADLDELEYEMGNTDEKRTSKEARRQFRAAGMNRGASFPDAEGCRETAASSNAERGGDSAASRAPILSVAESRRVRRRAKAEKNSLQHEKSVLMENPASTKAGIREAAASDGGDSAASSNAKRFGMDDANCRRAERGGDSDPERGGLLREMDPKEQERLIREVLNQVLQAAT